MDCETEKSKNSFHTSIQTAGKPDKSRHSSQVHKFEEE